MVKNVCLQINIAPVDLRYLVHTLPHQLRILGDQVEHIQFTVDSHDSRAGRFATDDHAGKLNETRRYLKEVCKGVPKAEIVEVDYDPTVVREVGHAFIGKGAVPKKAYSGSPIYPYLYGLFRSRCDYVFHTDSDMLYGGGSQNWIAEAIKLLETSTDVLACNPLAGPPRPDGLLKNQTAVCSDTRSFVYFFDKISTRVFIIDRRRFQSDEFKIPLVRSSGLDLLQSFLNNTSPFVNLEDCVSVLMRNRGLRRADFLGSGQGMWSLHPRYRSERFYDDLPKIIRRVELGDIPDAQRGDYDLNDSMIDWTGARRTKALRYRVYRQLKSAAQNVPGRIRSSWSAMRDANSDGDSNR